MSDELPVADCYGCGLRPATIVVGDGEPLLCSECGTPCGFGCCDAYEHHRAEEIAEAWIRRKAEALPRATLELFRHAQDAALALVAREKIDEPLRSRILAAARFYDFEGLDRELAVFERHRRAGG